MNTSKLTKLCQTHLATYKIEVGYGSMPKLSRLLNVDVCTLRNIESGKNVNATGVNIEKILGYFQDPLYRSISNRSPHLKSVKSRVA